MLTAHRATVKEKLIPLQNPNTHECDISSERRRVAGIHPGLWSGGLARTKVDRSEYAIIHIGQVTTFDDSGANAQTPHMNCVLLVNLERAF
jgi:hypothetical protein